MEVKVKKNLSTRDVLLKVRQFVAEDGARAELIAELSDQLSQSISDRANSASEALVVLENFLAHQSEVHGFSNELENLVVATAKQSRPGRKKATKKTSKKTKKKVTKKRSTSKRRKSADGVTFTTSADVRIENLSPRELQFVTLLDSRDRKFTTTKMLVSKGVIPRKDHATAKVNQLRKKGAPIESARQARDNDDEVSKKARGYRLISTA